MTKPTPPCVRLHGMGLRHRVEAAGRIGEGIRGYSGGYLAGGYLGTPIGDIRGHPWDIRGHPLSVWLRPAAGRSHTDPPPRDVLSVAAQGS